MVGNRVEGSGFRADGRSEARERDPRGWLTAQGLDLVPSLRVESIVRVLQGIYSAPSPPGRGAGVRALHRPWQSENRLRRATPTGDAIPDPLRREREKR